MKKVKSELPLSYVTIKTTKSRIDKGLLAIPVSLIDMFPKQRDKIHLVNERGIAEAKSFTPYNSSSRECRIGGLKVFYDNYKVSNGEELVIQLLDDDKYRIMPERLFKNILNDSLSQLKNSIDDDEADNILSHISEISNLQKIDILKNEFVILSNEKVEDRKKVEKNTPSVRESIPYSIRKILIELYEGKCQITNFSFLTKTNKPYLQ